jgi:hypothetical protein
MQSDPDDPIPAGYPSADITAAEFERWVTEFYATVSPTVQGMTVVAHG